MEMPSFLQSKQMVTPTSGGLLTDRKKKTAFITLVVLVFAIPLTIWLLQRSQIFSPYADVVPIALVMGDDSCVVSTDPNKVSCASFPIKLTSPLGPPTEVTSCTSDGQCRDGNKCFNYQSYPGSCKPVDTVCAAVITRACNPSNASECVDFPDPCHVPPGWVVDDGSRTSPTPTAGACTTTALSKTSNVDSASSITYVYTYPASTKIVSLNFPAKAGVGYAMNGQISSAGQALAVNLGAGQSTIQFTMLPTACTPFTAPFTMVNSCGTTMSDLVGPGSVSAYGAYCVASPSPSAAVCSTSATNLGSTVVSTTQINYSFTYPSKITKVNMPATPGFAFKVGTQTSASGAALNADLGAGTENVVITVIGDANKACSPFTISFTMINSCGQTISRFLGPGSASAYGSVCAASPSPASPNTGVSSGTDELGVNLQSQAICQGGFPIVLFSNGGRSDTGNMQIHRNGQALSYTFAGSYSRPPITQMKDTTGLNLNTQYAYYIQALDGPLAGKKSNTSTVTTLNTCPVAGMNWFQRLVKGIYPELISRANAQSLTLDNGLISEWRFDETSGNTAVDSKGVSNGTVTNAVVVDGKFNKARQITAANSGVVAADNAAYASNYFTVAGWVKPVSFGVGNFVSIFSRRNATNNQGLTLEYSGYEGAGNGQLQCVVFLNGGPNDEIRVGNTNTFKLNLNQWNHVVCSYDGTAVKVYINGSLAGTAAKSGTMKNGAGMEIKMGQNPFHPTNALDGTLDQVMYWNRALTDAEVSTLAGLTQSPSPTAVASASPSASPALSPSPTPAGPTLPGTSFYKVAETEAGLANAQRKPYIEGFVVEDFTFSSAAPGARQIWAEFIGADNTSIRREHIPVEIIEPAPQITSFDCSMDISRQNLKLTFNGARFGTGSGKVTLDTKEASVLAWSGTQVAANIKPEGNLEDGKLFKGVLTLADGKVLPEVTCQVGTTLISLGARLFCREPGKFDVNGVKVTLVDENGSRANEEVSIDASGLIKGLQTKLQVGKLYVISVKAPFSVRRNAQFTAASGTNVISPADGEVFILPVGDIAPVILPDGKINTLDHSEIVRQWSVLGSSTKTADFNRDTKINSIDWACMRYDFNEEDEAIPDKASPVLPSPVPNGPVSSGGSTGSASPAASGQRSAYFLLEAMEGGTYPNGDEFVVRVNVWSQNEAANLFSARLAFDPTALEVSRIEKGTALTSWVEENFDNQAGTIALTSGLPSPGLKTTEGNNPVMARIIFKGKKVGNATISVTNASKIYSNSDNANILSALLPAQVVITQ